MSSSPYDFPPFGAISNLSSNFNRLTATCVAKKSPSEEVIESGRATYDIRSLAISEFILFLLYKIVMCVTVESFEYDFNGYNAHISI